MLHCCFQTVSLCNAGWPWIYSPPASASWVRGLQVPYLAVFFWFLEFRSLCLLLLLRASGENSIYRLLWKRRGAQAGEPLDGGGWDPCWLALPAWQHGASSKPTWICDSKRRDWGTLNEWHRTRQGNKRQWLSEWLLFAKLARVLKLEGVVFLCAGFWSASWSVWIYCAWDPRGWGNHLLW